MTALHFYATLKYINGNGCPASLNLMWWVFKQRLHLHSKQMTNTPTVSGTNTVFSQQRQIRFTRYILPWARIYNHSSPSIDGKSQGAPEKCSDMLQVIFLLKKGNRRIREYIEQNTSLWRYCAHGTEERGHGYQPFILKGF